jgi:hypothetical protein
MENKPSFSGTPVLSLITNFSSNGSFERIYMVMGNPLPTNQVSNRKRQNRFPDSSLHWNGPEPEHKK